MWQYWNKENNLKKINNERTITTIENNIIVMITACPCFDRNEMSCDVSVNSEIIISHSIYPEWLKKPCYLFPIQI